MAGQFRETTKSKKPEALPPVLMCCGLSVFKFFDLFFGETSHFHNKGNIHTLIEHRFGYFELAFDESGLFCLPFKLVECFFQVCNHGAPIDKALQQFHKEAFTGEQQLVAFVVRVMDAVVLAIFQSVPLPLPVPYFLLYSISGTNPK
ncbi:MAG: hypothetical protein K0R28_4314 [Paenibacillus sp.]|nr:hypothetical protein [Paenibacillus sp.]